MIDHKLLKKKEKTVPTRGGGRNFILAAKSLIYKQTSSAFNQIWSRVWGLRMGLLSPQDVGRSPQKAQRPLPRLCCLNTKYQTSLSSLPPTRCLFPRNRGWVTWPVAVKVHRRRRYLPRVSWAPPVAAGVALSPHPRNSRMRRVLSDLEGSRHRARKKPAARALRGFDDAGSSARLLIWAAHDGRWKGKIQCARSNRSANYGPGLFHVKSGSCWGVDETNILQGSVPECETMGGRSVSQKSPEYSCHCLSLLPGEAGWRKLKSRRKLQPRSL